MLSPPRSSSGHVHVFLHELGLRFRSLFDDLPMFDLGNLVDVHDRISSILSRAGHLLSHLLCLIPRNLLDDIYAFGDWSFLTHGQESRADQLEKDSLSASTLLLPKCVIHVLVGEGIAHVQALREGSRSGPCVPSNLCLTGSSGLE